MEILKFILFFLSTTVFFGQNIDNYYTTEWVNAENGLKQLSVKNSVMDNQGFLWIATELGLYRYDGANAQEIKDKRFPSLSKQRIYKLGRDITTGNIYFKTNPEENVYVVKNSKIEKVTEKNFIEKVIFTRNNICYSNKNNIVNSILKNNKFKEIIELNQYGSSSTCALTKDQLYLSNQKKVVSFDTNNKLKTFEKNFSEIVLLMQFDESILAVDKGEIALLKNNEIVKKTIKIDAKFQEYIKRNQLSESNIEIYGSKNNYYLKCYSKIYKIIYDNYSISTQFLFNSPSDDIITINYSEEKNIYFIGTLSNGLAIVKPVNFNCIFFKNNDNNKSININYSVTLVSNYEWMSASGWYFNEKNKKTKTDNYLIDFRNNRFILKFNNNVFLQSQNFLWNAVNHKNDLNFTIPKDVKKDYSYFRDYTYYKNKLYIATGNKLLVVKKNILTCEFDFKKSRDINSIQTFNDLIIITTSKGVFYYHPETKKLTQIKGLEKTNARYIKIINKLDYWVGCYGDGLFLVSKNKIYKVNDSKINLNSAHAIEEDYASNLWISTNDGLLVINKKEAINRIKKNLPISCYKFTTDDGLFTNEFNGGSSHPSLKTKDGIIGFPSMKGFVWFNPKKIKKQQFNGQIFIDNIILDDIKTANSKNGIYQINKETKILKVNFSYGYYFNRENITILYRFEDQKNWKKISGNSFQIPRYKEGLQKLIIRISTNGFSGKQAISQTFNLNFEPKYYELAWFWGLMSIVFIFILYITYKIGIYYSRKREMYLKERIKEQTIELEHSILDLQKSKATLDKSLEVKNILLKEIHHRVKNNLQLVMSILNIQASDKEKTSIEGFIEKGQSRIASMVLIHENLYQKEDIGNIDFETYTESLVENIRTTFGEISDRIAVHINMKDVFFDIQTSIPLGLIINELVTNSFKHGFPNKKTGQITISIELLSGTNYKLTIEDTGIGFPKDKADKKSIGLELVSLLVLQLKGKLTIDSKKGTSYEIIFTL